MLRVLDQSDLHFHSDKLYGTLGNVGVYNLLQPYKTLTNLGPNVDDSSTTAFSFAAALNLHKDNPEVVCDMILLL